jgi:hypothetical protein
MVEQQMRSSILHIGSYWYSAWVDAGQPTLKNLVKIKPTEAEIKIAQKEELEFKQGTMKGRGE